MPKDNIWPEAVLSYFPIDHSKFLHQMIARLTFLFLVWLTGVVVYLVDGSLSNYLSNFSIYPSLFGTGFIILFGSYMIQRSLPENIESFKPLLKMEESQFRKLSDQIIRISCSLIPIVILDLVLLYFLSDVPALALEAFTIGVTLQVAWDILFTFFINLLTATGIWLGVSIWIMILLISRQPLNLVPSPHIIDNFRGLSKMALYFSSFYFLALSIGIAQNLLGSSAVSPSEILMSPLSIFIAIGVLSVLAPFYNIHVALTRLKKQELRKLEEEYAHLQATLDITLENKASTDFMDKTMAIMGSILSLQIKERNLRTAPEWPIDVSFLSKLLTLVLIPAIVRVSVEIFNRLYIV